MRELICYNRDIKFLCFDSHYYLSKEFGRMVDHRLGEVCILDRVYPKRQPMIHLVGGDFMSVPGHYVLPMREGSYDVFPGTFQNRKVMMMNMWTSSSGTPYNHPIVHVRSPVKRIDYGWYAHVSHVCALSMLHIDQINTIRFPERNMSDSSNSSPQAMFFMQKLPTLCPKTYPLIASMMDDYKAYAK